MPIQVLQHRRVHEQIAEQLRTLVASGEYPPGGRLPPERELAVRLGVSRGSLRQALVALEVGGVLDIRVGSGVFVTADALTRVHHWTPGDGAGLPPLDIVAARALVESETAALAAENATDEQLRGVVLAAASLRDAEHRYDLRHPADRAFHLRIAEASGNRALLHLVTELWDCQRGPLYRRLEDHFSTPRMRDLAIDDHQAIVDALLGRDPSRARRAMRRHLDRVHAGLAAGAGNKAGG
ncbi:FadR/GntR family transcriptional regulator [Arenibaculum pallidiluteum]|uniref:FadR/GntR family transcriptional regulator n=1 Tax=Arenibaculum pallidiluteum TaxID=2812559 RepID=UPI001A97A401|nr:FadR/GntR family transcriptional regulator [Arenibaculum pallidiluteum]